MRPGSLPELLVGLAGSQLAGRGGQIPCVTSLLEKGCLGLDSGYPEQEER